MILSKTQDKLMQFKLFKPIDNKFPNFKFKLGEYIVGSSNPSCIVQIVGRVEGKDIKTSKYEFLPVARAIITDDKITIDDWVNITDYELKKFSSQFYVYKMDDGWVNYFYKDNIEQEFTSK